MLSTQGGSEMKRLLLLCLSSIFAGTLALAAEKEEGKTTVDHSHNPLTGSDTTTKTTTAKKKDASGKTHTYKKKETTTKKTDGGAEHSTSTEETSSPAD
jgi:hypothetical protein